MNLEHLQDVLRAPIINLYNHKGKLDLPEVCKNLGLPIPEIINEMTKRQIMTNSFDSAEIESLPLVAEQYLRNHKPQPPVRNRIQDVLWADSTVPQINKKIRREVARSLEIDDIYGDFTKFENLLSELWIIDNDPLAFFGGVDHSLRAEIQRHVFNNPEDWSVEELFDKIGAYDASDKRFILFLEGMASPEVQPYEESQRNFIEKINVPLQKCNIEMRETDILDGYPQFKIVSNRAVSLGSPKNLIFASPMKPDLRFRDAVNNDIEIVTNADKVLIYDRPISAEGLRWCDLQLWWKETMGILDDVAAKKTLYSRLRDSLPETSPPQKLFFSSYYKVFGKAIPDLPALLPEVWLHWDPKTVKERGTEALTRFRMDYLLLLPNGVRIVIEVDGKHHYANATGQADCARYAEMVAADRELKLVGYDLYRFGGIELQEETAQKIVKDFFYKLYKKYSINVS